MNIQVSSVAKLFCPIPWIHAYIVDGSRNALVFGFGSVFDHNMLNVISSICMIM
jgi:hypothetical protein